MRVPHKACGGVGIVVHHIKLLLGIPAFHIGASIWVLAPHFVVRFPAEQPGRQQMMVPLLGLVSLLWETWKELPGSRLWLAQSRLLWPLGSDQVDRRYFSVSFSFSSHPTLVFVCWLVCFLLCLPRFRASYLRYFR